MCDDVRFFPIAVGSMFRIMFAMGHHTALANSRQAQHLGPSGGGCNNRSIERWPPRESNPCQITKAGQSAQPM